MQPQPMSALPPKADIHPVTEMSASLIDRLGSSAPDRSEYCETAGVGASDQARAGQCLPPPLLSSKLVALPLDGPFIGFRHHPIACGFGCLSDSSQHNLG
jgi:hypothetical protein